MTKNALAFVFERHNQQSISPVIGAVETDERLDDLEVHLLRPKSGLSWQVEALAASYDRVVLGFSFTTFKVPQVFEAVRRVRHHLGSRRLENVTLIAGGPHPSGDWRGTLNWPPIARQTPQIQTHHQH